MSELIYHTKFLDLKSHKSPSDHDWFYVHRTNDAPSHDSAVVLTTLVKINGEYNFLFLKTKRPPLYGENKAEFCLESPAGLIGDNDSDESLSECIKKELLEETGLVADKIYIEGKNFSSSSGLTSETLSFVTVIVDNYNQIQKPVSDGGIIVDRFFVKSSDIYSFLNQIDTKKISIATATICGIFYSLNRI